MIVIKILRETNLGDFSLLLELQGFKTHVGETFEAAIAELTDAKHLHVVWKWWADARTNATRHVHSHAARLARVNRACARFCCLYLSLCVVFLTVT